MVHPVENYVGKPPVLVVTNLEAEHEPRPMMGDLYNFTAVIVPGSDVQGSEQEAVEVTGYCDPSHHTGMVWLNTD